MNAIRAYLIEKAFELVTDYLQDPDNIAEWRQFIKDEIQEFVDDTETPWDDEAAAAVLNFLGW